MATVTHNPKVAGSNPVPATNEFLRKFKDLREKAQSNPLGLFRFYGHQVTGPVTELPLFLSDFKGFQKKFW